jgi:hypothetical protein
MEMGYVEAELSRPELLVVRELKYDNGGVAVFAVTLRDGGRVTHCK